MAGNASSDILITHMYDLCLNPFSGKDLLHLMQGNVSVPFGMRTSVDH